VELRIAGTTLHVESAGTGVPCLCLHGGPGTDSSGIQAALGPLAKPLGLRMVFWDHRGHGRSEWVPAEQCTQDRLVADVEAVRTALGFARVACSASAGAAFSRSCTPRDIRSSSTPSPSSARPRATSSCDARRKTRARGQHPSIAVRDFIVRHEYPKYDCRSELARITCPMWIAVGRHDSICPVDQAQEIHRLVPHSTLSIFERSGHSPHIEEREEFARQLGAFFAAST
jgi:proline iminopeptidase